MKSHPAFDILDQYFQQRVMGRPLQGGTADAQVPMAQASAVDPAAAQQIEQVKAVQEVARDGALIQMLAQAMGVPIPGASRRAV